MTIGNPLSKIHEFGQSIWLDFIRKGMIASGEIASLIKNDGVLGMTSNPSIFEKAISSSNDYEDAIRKFALDGRTSQQIYQLLTVQDIQSACDLFQQTYLTTKGRDGFVSLEVSPQLAYDTEKTIVQARELWKKVGRPNLLVKVPATAQGVLAIKQLISEGVNVNATLLFSIDRYQEVAEAFLSGLEDRLKARQPISGIASVASFFLSRIDVAVDECLEFDSPLRGKIAIASAKIAYQKYLKIFGSSRFEKLKARGALSQRLLWASTSTKNAIDSDIKYVEALIGRDTVNTLPLETLNAYRDHGKPADRLESEIAEANSNIELLKNQDIELSVINQDLEDEGVHKFSSAFDKLMTSLELKRQSAIANAKNKNSGSDPQIQNLSFFNCGELIQNRLQKLRDESFSDRIWQKDPSLWSSEKNPQEMIRNSLGWLRIAEAMQTTLNREIEYFAKEIRDSGYEHVVHMGMGGSSLAALVFGRTFSNADGLPLTILDTTNPETIGQIEKKIKVEKTLFIVASKSGTTAEPLAFKDYFYERVREIKGDKAGENFVAITDPNTPLVQIAQDQKFRKIFYGRADIGGRYSALSVFGLVPAAFMGININEIVGRALEAARLSNLGQKNHDPSCLILGAVLGEMSLQKRNKVTLLIEEPLQNFGLWLEQLMAESTGKNGKGLIPVSGEAVGAPNVYGVDRLFVYVTCKAFSAEAKPYNESLKRSVLALRGAGQPVVHIEISTLESIGGEFFNWEYATAVAGSILEINAFDQPNVQESKDITDKLLSHPEEINTEEKASFIEKGLSFYSNSNCTSGIGALTEFLQKASAGDYIALMAFLPENPETLSALQNIRTNLRDQFKLATTLGYGPRFLHSTGQLHKGGPNTGLFIQLTSDDEISIPILGRSYTFGDFKTAQAKGDLETLQKHDRRTLRIHLGKNITNGLKELEELVRVSLELK